MATALKRRPLLLSLLLAALLHLVGAALVLILWPREPSNEHGRIMDHTVELVAIRERPPAIPAVDKPRPTLREEQPAPMRPVRQPVRQPVRRPSKPAPGPHAAPPGQPLDLSMRGLDLSPSADLFDDERQDEIPRARRSERASEAARVKRRIDRWLREDEGRRNVQLGSAHPAMFTVLRRVQRLFAPTEQMIPDRLRHPGKEYLRSYAASIKAFNRMGSSLPLDYKDLGLEHKTPAKLLAGDAEIRAGAREGRERLVTEICIRTAAGQMPEVEKQRVSGARALDRHARKAMERALRLAPVECPPLEACFQLGVEYGRVLPDVNCVATGILDGFKCLRRGGRYFKPKVRLVAYWPGASKKTLK